MIRVFVALALMTSIARADFVRGSIKIDVRDAAGKPREADVRVSGPNGDVKVTRSGDVYVTGGLVDGEYRVTVDGATQPVRVAGRLDRGVVFAGNKVVALGLRDTPCDAADGAVVEAVVFARGGGLGAGRIDVRKHAGNKLVCSAVAAGGAATMRLPPGDYLITAHTVGGGTALERYLVPRDRAPYPLALRAR